jgi:hypothetical protein
VFYQVPLAIGIFVLSTVLVVAPWRNPDWENREAAALLVACAIRLLLAALNVGVTWASQVLVLSNA